MSGKTARDYADRYTQPKLREQLKEELKRSNKGGRPGQWSARKSQLLATEYQKKGGGFRDEGRGEPQAHLEAWQREEWQTQRGDARARHGETTERYLPKRAWQRLSPEEKAETDRAKRRGSREGRQYVPNPPAAKRAARQARQPPLEARTKKDLYEDARRRGIEGRSKMNKGELVRALRRR